eukprot:TRINITY_DN11861_c0_g1_i1.p2 TRINITY_DN11861_c0_g1~~TRINITY_DN11861_c0_g1_i1.p2  ORF type:complete len:146 (-),score=53.57 TRINITY_DN11861_c0_g1_i1:49-486(-)
MSFVVPHLRLRYAGAQKILESAIRKAEEIKVPQCVVVVDDGGHLLSFARMDGAKVLSIDSALAKARTAASSRVPTGGVPAEMEQKLSMATGLKLTNLKGGLPIVVEGHVIGAIGVGSGTGDQDVEVAKAGLAALADALSTPNAKL